MMDDVECATDTCHCERMRTMNVLYNKKYFYDKSYASPRLLVLQNG